MHVKSMAAKSVIEAGMKGRSAVITILVDRRGENKYVSLRTQKTSNACMGLGKECLGGHSYVERSVEKTTVLFY